MVSSDSRDPFAIFHAPPPNETARERASREAREATARKVSQRIDDELRAEKARMKRERIVRVLLLGQSESGKSTTLKNFRLRYARAAWDAERLAWRSVIQLNVVRSLRIVFNAVQAEVDGVSTNVEFSRDESLTSSVLPVARTSNSSTSHSPSLSVDLTETNSQALMETYNDLRGRLAGLEVIERELMLRLGAGSEEDYGDASPVAHDMGHPVDVPLDTHVKPEWGVQHLQNALLGTSSQPNVPQVTNQVDIPSMWLSEHRDAAKALWEDAEIRKVLRQRHVRVEDGAGFFLDDIDRIGSLDYIPSDTDVVRSRLRTLGVQEYRIHFDSEVGQGAISSDMGRDWVLYDVGGSRSMRHAWVPYFDNIQAIIFLAPVSCFDERLNEDSKVNRLEDSFLLFREICASKLLAKATIVLFLNKCDLLKRKLRAGVQVKNYLPSFGTRSNDVSTVVKYLREKFREVLKEHSPEQRSSHFYATSVIDTEATATTISAVRDSILQNYLKKADFI